MTKNEARTLLKAVNICMDYKGRTCVDCPYNGIKKEHSELCGLLTESCRLIWNTVREVVFK